MHLSHQVGIDFIKELTEASSREILPLFADPSIPVEKKSDKTVVTEADRNAERVMRKLINERFPDHGIMGEEYGVEGEDSEYMWVLDPIDGTVSFVHGCPLFGTLIALLRNGQPILGAIHQPVIGQLCIGNNEECWMNDKPVHFRDVSQLSDATLLATDIKGIAKYANIDNFNVLLDKTHHMRTWGDCYGYLLLASGFGDIMLDPIMNPWDILPVIPIIRGAGGKITSWDGGDPVQGESCIAAATNLHDEVIAILNS